MARRHYVPSKGKAMPSGGRRRGRGRRGRRHLEPAGRTNVQIERDGRITVRQRGVTLHFKDLDDYRRWVAHIKIHHLERPHPRGDYPRVVIAGRPHKVEHGQ